MANLMELVGDAIGIAERYEALVAEAEDGELDERAVAVLAGEFGENEAAFRDKVDAYIAVMRQYEAWEKTAKAEAKRLTDRAKAHGNHAKRLKESLKYAMETLEIDKTKTAQNTVTLAVNPSIPYDVNLDEVSETYLRTKVELDKTAIQKALKAGLDISGITTKEQQRSLRIR